jgi:hypothetical protein
LNRNRIASRFRTTTSNGFTRAAKSGVAPGINPAQAHMTHFAPANDKQGDSNVSTRAKTPSRRTGLGVALRGTLGGYGSGASLRRRSAVMSAVLGVCILMLGLLAPNAGAAITHNPEPFSSLGGSGSGLTLTGSTGVAVDEETGNVFVADIERVAILGSEGGAPIGLTPPFEIPGILFEAGTPPGLAFDNSATSPSRGTLYAYDRQTETVKRYTRNPTSEKYENTGAELAVPNAFIVALSVDNAGNLYVSNEGFGENIIDKYSPAGTLLTEYNFTQTGQEVGPLAVDSEGDIFIAEQNGGLYKYPANNMGEIEPEVHTQVLNRAVNGVTIDPATDQVYATSNTAVFQVDATSGNQISEFGTEQIGSAKRIAVTAAGQIYVADNEVPPGVDVFGPAVTVPTSQIAAASGVTGVNATLNGSVDAEGLSVTECFFEWGPDENGQPKYEHQAQCEPAPPTDSELHPVHADLTGLVSDGATYHFRLVARNENGTERSADEAFTTTATVFTETATAVRTDSATLHGTVDPEGRQYTDCHFEYGLTTAFGFEHAVDCEPEASEIPAEFSAQAVSVSLEGLHPGADYKFRLSATNSGGTVEGETLTFSTVGPPRITEVLARDADQGSATLEATVDPRGAIGPTSYRIESGPTTSYGNIAATGTIASGAGPTSISARIVGLAPATTYHYRVVATSAEGGESASLDQQVETLNSCGFTDDRCLELVSRADKGPLASPGKLFLIGAQIQFQAAAAHPAFAFTVYSGYPDATAGDAALYLAQRGLDGWSSDQLTPPNNVEPFVGGNGSNFEALSSELGCGVVASRALLVPGAPAGVVEAGGQNLYVRDNATNSYRLITDLPPVGPPFTQEGAAIYQVISMSPDCGRVVFRTGYRYPGIPVVGSARYQLYEWDHGTLRNLAIIPGPGGTAEPVAAESIPGALGVNPESEAPGEEALTNSWRAVSTDASRSVFTAVSRFGADSGRHAVFLRDGDNPAVLAGTAPAIDVSQSETATPNDGNSRYWMASADGSRVLFTARYGLAANGSSTGATSCANTPLGGAESVFGEGCDLYEYDATASAGARLTDLSPDVDDPSGAGVAGVLDASEDGSFVYFAARGDLGDAGKTEAENLKDGTYNIYLAHAGSLRFVRSLGQAEAFGGNALVNTVVTGQWTSRATDDGTSFAFESSLGVPGGVPMVYLYSAVDGTTTCVSCRHDGQTPFSEARLTPLIDSRDTNAGRTAEPTILTRNGRLYFYSFDPLAPGAVEGDRNLYQWEHDQVSLVATEPPGVIRNGDGTPGESFFGGAGADGDDVYFATPQSLAGAAEGGWNVYDARVGGGLPEPAAPALPCDASAEGACNSGGANPPAGAPPATSTFTGPSNPSARKHHKKHAKKHHKKHAKKHHKRTGKAGRANGDRRAGK